MAQHVKLSANTYTKVYHWYQHRPWQRGSSENINRMIRLYLPKCTDLSIYS